MKSYDLFNTYFNVKVLFANEWVLPSGGSPLYGSATYMAIPSTFG